MDKITFISKFANYLEINKINYVLLGNPENLKNQNEGDIDLAIDELNFKNIDRTINLFTHANNCSLVQIIEHESTSKYYVIYYSEFNSYFQLDICSDYKSNGRTILKSNYFFEDTLKNSLLSLNFLSPENEFCYYLIKKSIKKKGLTKEQFKHLNLNWQKSDKILLKYRLCKFIKPKSVELLSQYFEVLDYESIAKVISSYKSISKRNFKFKIKDIYLEIKRIITRTLKPTGLVIAVMGRDGSGKSTIIKELQKSLAPAFRRSDYFHLYPTFDKSIKVNPKKNCEPHSLKSRNSLLSFFKLMYLILVYNSGYYFNVLILKTKSSLIIFDRYYHDLLVDQTRYRHKGLTQLKVFSFIIPKPDIWLFIDAPTWLVHERKPEVTKEISELQRKLYIELAESLENSKIIDSSICLHDSVHNCINFVIPYLKGRIDKRN